MKLFLLLTFVSFSAFAVCPSTEHQRENGYRLYPEDTDREIYLCKLTKSSEFKKLEFCLGRVSSSMVSDYIGLAGVYTLKSYPDDTYGLNAHWMQLDGDKEGWATDSRDYMEFEHKPTPAIIIDKDQYRYTVKLNKKTGAATYVRERKSNPCFLCGGWKPMYKAELNCKLIR